jgi:hypothetical protein
MVVRGSLEPVAYNPEPNHWRLQDIICYVLLPADQTNAATYRHSWAVFDRKPPVEQVFWRLGICIERTSHHYVLPWNSLEEGQTNTDVFVQVV